MGVQRLQNRYRSLDNLAQELWYSNVYPFGEEQVEHGKGAERND